MSEKIIYLENIDPVEFYGVNNSNLELVKKYFPKLKIIARGNEIKAMGEPSEISIFEQRFYSFIEHFTKYNRLVPDNIENIMFEEPQPVNEIVDKNERFIIHGNTGKPIKAQTFTQVKMVEAYDTNDLVFAIGPAGTGKTYTAIALAVRSLKNREVKRIILSRPAVEAGENLGFLPGDMKEKLDPYLQALYDALYDMIPLKTLNDMMQDKIIQIAPLAYMRGRTLDNASVILDEAQNATINQLKMFLTRMGRNAKFMVTGDVTQIDLPRKQDCGLIKCQQILQGINGISFLYFDERDIIRHPLVKRIVEAYDKDVIRKRTLKNEIESALKDQETIVIK